MPKQPRASVRMSARVRPRVFPDSKLECCTRPPTAVLMGMPAASITCRMSRIGEVGCRFAMACRASG